MIPFSVMLPTLLAFQQDLTKLKVADGGGSFFFPPEASTFAKPYDGMYDFIQWVSIVFGVLIFAVLFGFVAKYNRKKHPVAIQGNTHNLALELLWSVPPGFLLFYMFWIGFKGFLDLREPPRDAYTIAVSGQKWAWSFSYPNGAKSGELHVPVNRPVMLTMTSQDVIHSLYIPAFRCKQDVVPGRTTRQWFVPTRIGTYVIECAEYCGTSHSDMLTKCVVHEQADFDAWVKEAANWLGDWIKAGKPLAEAGRRLYTEELACKTCHTIDGTKFTGPTFKDAWGRHETLTDGRSVTVDEAYFRKSIKEPTADVVSGFTPVMAPQPLDEDQVKAMIEFLKSISEHK